MHRGKARPSRRGQPTGSRATIHDVAAAAAVSVATVSRVLNGTANVMPETVARVREAMDMLDFVPSSVARNLSLQRTNTLGLLFPEISGPFFAQSLRGIESVARAAGYNLLIYSMSGHADASAVASVPLCAQNTDGLLIMSGAVADELVRKLHALRVPLVLVYRSLPGLPLPAVTIENRDGARRLVEHLIGLGHRRIAHIHGPRQNEDSLWRARGYYEALAAHGLAPDPALIAHGSFSEETGASAASELLARGTPFTALFAADDETAIGAMAALSAAGLRVPQDVAVVGFDDIATARYVQPPLTTVRAPTEQVGREAVRLLLAAIAGEPAPAQPVLLPVELVIRQSCGANVSVIDGSPWGNEHTAL
jgi:DNA-binding LacI/PurR family transcriptional regulator